MRPTTVGSSTGQIHSRHTQRTKRLDGFRGYPGHTHFWERASSRRGFLQVAGAVAGLIGTGHWMKTNATTVSADIPKPIPGGFTFPGFGNQVFHNSAPGVFDPLNTDRSGIFDFNGHIGYAVIDGLGTGTNTVTHATTRLAFECDVRFMRGVYIATDGKYRNRTFALL